MLSVGSLQWFYHGRDGRMWSPLFCRAFFLRKLMGQMQEMDTSEVERNAQLGIQHAERLAAHGYRQVHPAGLHHPKGGIAL